MKRVLLPLALATVVPACALAQQEVGEVYASDAAVRGSIVLAASGTKVLSGSQVTAGEKTALLKLSRGGQVRICPKTNLSVGTDQSGRGLVLGLNQGSAELHYEVTSGSDSLLTPDFRLQLIGPGAFHLAISVSPKGDTCIRTLPGNNAAAFVSELMGSEAYQLAPERAVLFREGKISGSILPAASCGCPVEPAQPLVAAAPIAPQPKAPEAPPVTPTHIQVDTPLYFDAKESRVSEDSAPLLALSTITETRSLGDVILGLLPHVQPAPEKLKVVAATAPAKPAAKPKEAGQGDVVHAIGRFFRRLFS